MGIISCVHVGLTFTTAPSFIFFSALIIERNNFKLGNRTEKFESPFWHFIFRKKKSLFKATYGQQIEMMRNRPLLADCAIAYLLWLRTVPNDYFDWVDVNIHWRSSVLFRKSCPSLNTCMGLKVFSVKKLSLSSYINKKVVRQWRLLTLSTLFSLFSTQ